MVWRCIGYSNKVNWWLPLKIRNHSAAYHYLSNPFDGSHLLRVWLTITCERMCIVGDVLSEEPQTLRFPCANGLAKL